MDGQNIALIKNITLVIWTFAPPAIIIIGTIGNILSLLTVTYRHCRKSSFTVYLAALAITDTAYLYVSVLSEWLINAFDINFGSFRNIWCKMAFFLSFLASHASSWLIVALTFERTFCTYFPSKTKTVCVPRTGYIVVSTIIGVLLLMNVHLLYAVQGSEVTVNNTFSTICEIDVPGYKTVYANIFAWVDLLIYFLLPVSIIVIANSATVVGILRRNSLTAALTTVNSNRMKRNRYLLIITLLVSCAFVIFLSPVTIFLVVMPNIYEDIILFPAKDRNIIYLIFTALSNWSFLNHAVNFFLYILSGERFRRELKTFICKSSAERSAD